MSISSRRLLRNQGISILIDDWTNSIVEVSTGKSFETGFKLMSSMDAKEIGAKDWFFKWKEELKLTDRQVYKMYVNNYPELIQGLISLTIERGVVIVHKVENPKWNNPKYLKGKKQKYKGVGTNLFAFACKISKENGFDGEIGFVAKHALIKHYITALGAFVVSGQRMGIDKIEANKLINFYFK